MHCDIPEFYAFFDLGREVIREDAGFSQPVETFCHGHGGRTSRTATMWEQEAEIRKSDPHVFLNPEGLLICG